MATAVNFPEGSWSGQEVDEFRVHKLLRSGLFCWVCLAEAADQRVVLKIGKPEAVIVAEAKAAADPDATRDPYATRALGARTGGFYRATARAADVLAKQVASVNAVADPVFVPLSEVREWRGLAYVSMPFVQGPSLRQLLNDGGDASSALAALIRELARLSENKAFRYHGDLKPENVIVAQEGVKIIDPGYFGDPCQEYCMTTPAYYPRMQPDDLFSVGVMLWEALLGWHPLMRSDASENAGQRNWHSLPAKGRLQQEIRGYQLVGNHFLTPLLVLPRPKSLQRKLTNAQEVFLLKALRLRLDWRAGIDVDAGFTDFSMLYGAMRAARLAD